MESTQTESKTRSNGTPETTETILAKMNLKNAFKNRPQHLSELLKWLFTPPLTYIIFISLSLLIPFFGSSNERLLLRLTASEALLALSFLLVVKYFIGYRIPLLFSVSERFSVGKFLLAFFIGLASISLSTSAWRMVSPADFRISRLEGIFITTQLCGALLVAVASLSEELIFRAYIAHFNTGKTSTGKPPLKSRKSTALRCLASGAFFMVAHFQNPEVEGSKAVWSMAFYFLFGCFLMLMYLDFGGIEIPLALHFSNNLFETVVCGYEGAVIKTQPFFIHTNNIGFPLLAFAALDLALFYFLSRTLIIKENTGNTSQLPKPSFGEKTRISRQTEAANETAQK